MYAKHRFCWKGGVFVNKFAMKLYILPVCFHILYKISLTVFKCIYGSAPDYLKNVIVLSQPKSGLCTSNHANHLVPLPFPEYCKVSNAFRYFAHSVWNNLYTFYQICNFTFKFQVLP